MRVAINAISGSMTSLAAILAKKSPLENQRAFSNERE
jgi:hypothetical protein